MMAMPLVRRAAELIVQRGYRPAMFEAYPEIYRTREVRRPWLDLPFRSQDFVGAAVPD